MDEIGGDPGATLFSGDFASRIDAFDQILWKLGKTRPFLGRFLAQSHLNGRGILIALFCLLCLCLLPPLCERFLRRIGHLRPNFRNETIPQSFGIMVLACALLCFGATIYLIPSARPEYLPWVGLVAGFGGLGALDDFFGDKRHRGLKGHFRAAFQERRITTGFLKAAGGLALAGILAHGLYPESLFRALLAMGVIALSANSINLFDLRPGRACAVFLLLATPLLFALLFRFSWIAGLPPLIFVVLPAWTLWERDARATVMMGDTGSNLLGACLGFALAHPAFSPLFQGFCFAALFGLHILTERISITAEIERRPFLQKLDRLTGER